MTEHKTCPTACVEYNHPGREHDEWLGSIRVLGALSGYAAGEQDARADAWDEGHRLARPHSDACEPTCPNPYRQDAP